jgi:hypothetical protein
MKTRPITLSEAIGRHEVDVKLQAAKLQNNYF